jgi:glycoside/pentoside/hexuronide:cation symporter, GPH family
MDTILDNNLAKANPAPLRALEKPPLWLLMVYAVGQMGWSVAGAGITNMLEYFYFPPETTAGHTLFPSYVYQGAVFGVMTVLGLIGASGRFMDAIVDPIVAYWSDKLEFSWGKRRVFMAFSAIPCALFTWLLYLPPVAHESNWNIVWLVVLVMLMYFCWTCYVVPYTALISELGHTEREQVLISAFISVGYALGFMLVAQAQRIQGWLEADYGTTQAFQIAMGIIMTIGAFCMLLPIPFLDEKRYCLPSEPMPDFKESWKRVWENVNFKWFAVADFFYWFGLNFIQKGAQYYIIVLLLLDKSAVSDFTMKIGGLSFLAYLPLSWAALHFSKKKMVSVAFVLMSCCFVGTAVLGWVPISPSAQLWILVLLAMLPIATFGILQNVIVADIIHEQLRTTGVAQAGMFYAVRAMMMKFGVSASTLVFPSLLLLGKSQENDTGVRLTGVVAAVFCMIGFFIFQNFKETPRTK